MDRERTINRGDIGALSDARVDQVLAGLRFLQRSFFTR